MSIFFDMPLPEHVIRQRKEQAREAAKERRRLAVNKAHEKRACRHLADFLHHMSPLAMVSLYYPIRTEISPLAALSDKLPYNGDLCLPVVTGSGEPLEFRAWTSRDPLVDGAFGAKVPKSGKIVTPDILIVPLLAFDVFGARLGYGGGYYDRTLEKLRAAKEIRAVGFAYGAQRVDRLPVGEQDQKLDLYITEKGLREAVDPGGISGRSKGF